MNAKVRRLCQHYADTYKIHKECFMECRTKADAREVIKNSQVKLQFYLYG